MARTTPLTPGEPAPWFAAATSAMPRFVFDNAAGRHVVLCLLGSAGDPAARDALAGFARLRDAFDDDAACLFGVTTDPIDVAAGRVADLLPGIRFFHDFDRAVSTAYGAADPGADVSRPDTLVLDERLRAVAAVPLDGSPGHAERVVGILKGLPPVGDEDFAPVLVVPRVFEPGLCRTLTEYYDRLGGRESGFMREVGGRTVEVADPAFKRRRDREVADDRLRTACMHRVHDRLVPEIARAFLFKATRIERYVVACYDAASGGYFRAHRDNTTRGTAHRRFAVSLNLNTGDYDGGRLRFPEFGGRLYAAPAGGAVVFSCSLLHEATPVTAGKRYAFLPFLYDDEAARVRERNAAFVG